MILSNKLKVSIISKGIQVDILKILDTIPQIEIISRTSNPGDFFPLRSEIPNLILVELNGEINFPEWLDKMASRLPQTAIILCSQSWSPDLLTQANRIGVKEHLTIPFTLPDLESAIERACPTRILNQPGGYKKGNVIVVTGYKGGIGVTTLAINLALALSEQTQNKVALIDLGRPFPDIANFLNLQVKRSLYDLINHEGNIDISILKNTMYPYGIKLDILNKCLNNNDLNSLDNGFIEHICNLMRTMYSHIVIDLSQGIDKLFTDVINYADMVLLLSGTTASDLVNLRAIWPLLIDMINEDYKLKVIVNRINKGNDIQLQQLKIITKNKPFETLPSDYHLLMESQVKRIPLNILAPRSRLWRKIKNLAERIQREIDIGSKNTPDKVSRRASFRLMILALVVLGTVAAFFLAANVNALLKSFRVTQMQADPLQQKAIMKTTENTPDKGGSAAIAAPEVQVKGETPQAKGPAPKTQQVQPSKREPPSPPKEGATLGVGKPTDSHKTPEVASEGKYVGSRTSNKYHYPDCKWVKQIRPENILRFKSAQEAQKEGYVPCPTCKTPRSD
jgi:pilus assembly protein CpaE